MTTPINRTPSQRQSMSPRNSPLGERTSVSPLHPIHGTTSNGNQQAAKLRRRASSALEGMALHVHARDSAYRQSLAKPPTLYGPSSHLSPTRQRILFYHKQDPHYGFTNFSPHPVMYNGLEYPTSEHLFQSFKFQGHRPQIAERIRVCSPRPSVAFEEARKFQPEVRRDWFRVNIEMMDEALWHKFAQHDDLKRELLATGDAELVEDSDKDPFWGIGADKKGRNELGKALERLRDNLRNSGVTGA